MKTKWIAAVAIVAAAIIGSLPFYCNKNKAETDNSINKKVTQHVDSGSNQYAERDIMTAGKDVIKSEGPLTIVVDSSKTITNKQTVIDKSFKIEKAESGSISGYELHVTPDTNADVPNNFTIDVIHQSDGRAVLKIAPKVGRWARPFLAVPAREYSVGAIEFAGAIRDLEMRRVIANGDTLFSEAIDGPVAFDSPAYINYNKVFSEIRFGDAKNPKRQYVIKGPSLHR